MKPRRKSRAGQQQNWIAVLLLDRSVVRGADGRFLIVTAYTAKAARHALKPYVSGPFQVQIAS